MKRMLFLYALLCACACSARAGSEPSGRDIHDIWVLTSVWYPGDITVGYPNRNGVTELCIYDDSVAYVCSLRLMKDAISILPQRKFGYTAASRGGGTFVYTEEGERHPCRLANDTTLVVQRYGVRFTQTRASGFVRANRQRIADIARGYDYSGATPPERYVISQAEVEMQRTNHTLFYIVGALLVMLAAVAAYAVHSHCRTVRLRRRLHEIEEERQGVPAKMRMAQEEVESDFFRSPYYLSVKERLARGDKFGDDDWKELERHLKQVYPHFAYRLQGLVRMSEVEYRVCMLVKLNIIVRDIAQVMNKTPSSISSIRSRLYQKVFQKKGGASDWDAFIMSL